MGNLLVVAICLGLGVALRGRVDPAPLGRWVLLVALPAVVIAQMHDTQHVSFVGVGAMWLVFAAAAVVYVGLGHLCGWDRPTVACLVLCTGLSNTSFVGFPLLEAFVGPDAIAYAVPIDQLGSFLIVTICGPVVVAVARPGGQLSARTIGLAVARFPGLWALMAVLLVPSWPAPLLDAAARIGGTMSPIALFVAGLNLRRPDGDSAPLLGIGLLWKLGMAPLLVWGWVAALGARGLSAEVTVLEAAMAPMITGALLAESAGLRPTLAAAFLSIGVPLSVLTVWAWSTLVLPAL